MANLKKAKGTRQEAKAGILNHEAHEEGTRDKGVGNAVPCVPQDNASAPGLPQADAGIKQDDAAPGVPQDDTEMKQDDATTDESADKVLYQFASYPVCPRCGTRDNYASSTQGPIQYRKCRRANCRRSWKVIGVAVRSVPRAGGSSAGWVNGGDDDQAVVG
jgi:hypothetical protein